MKNFDLPFIGAFRICRAPRAFVALLLLSVLAGHAASVESTPVAVTVYQDRAAVTRLAKVEVVPGEQLIELAELPIALNESSLQADGKGTVEVTILDIASRVEHTQQTVNPRVRELEDEKRGLERQVQSLEEQVKLLNAETASLKSLEIAMTHTGGNETPRPSFKELTEMLPFLAAQRKRISDETQAIDRQRESLADRLRVLERQLAELRGTGAKAHRVVSVRLQSAAAGKFDLRVTYQVPKAGWTPLYDARLRSDTREVELTYFGSVRNGTGENWKDVALTLSTAQPSQGGGAPEPAPWIVDVAQPIMPRSRPAMQDKAETSAFSAKVAREQNVGAINSGAVALAAPLPPEEIQAQRQVVSRVDRALTSATFKIETPIALPSDNTSKKVAIAQVRLPTGLLYKTTPKSREAAFLGAKVTNTTEFPLLAGAVNVFLDNAFVATSGLKSVMAGEKFDLALGVDEGISVKRRLVNRFSEDTGITGKGRRVTYEILLTVANNKKTPERVEVREAVPVSRNEKIEVSLASPQERELGSPDSAKEIVRDVEGRLTWRLNLKPGEKRDLTLKFSIEHPANLSVTGLE